MKMLNNVIKSVNIDCANGFKFLFVTNNFDGSEDFLVSNKIYHLVGTELTPAKGVKGKLPSKEEQPVDEGYEIFDGYNYDEATVTDDIVGEYSDDDKEVVESQEDQAGTYTTEDPTSEPVEGRQLYPKHSYVVMIKYADDCNDVDITMDANFLDNTAKTLDENEYSPRMKRFAFHMQATLQKARRNLMSRISWKIALENVENNDNDNNSE